MPFRHVAAAVTVVLLVPACTAQTVSPVAVRTHPTRSPADRTITRPKRARVVFHARGDAARRLRQAELDLKRIKLWDKLANHLYEVKVTVRPGRSDIPNDRHLADAYPSAVAAPGGYGSLCDIAFYPAAISADLVRWRRYHSQGRLGRPPATLRQYWGAILAHELGHCRANGKGEPAAEKWERVALHKLRHRPRS
jgi:hypothetical protein